MQTFQTAAPEITAATARLERTWGARIREARVGGRYSASVKLTKAAEAVIAEAIAHHAVLAEEIGADTQLGSMGTPATALADWRGRLRHLSPLPSA